MFRSIQPLQFLLTLPAGWINRRQLEVIEYLSVANCELDGGSQLIRLFESLDITS
jgi:hypothetical protein